MSGTSVVQGTGMIALPEPWLNEPEDLLLRLLSVATFVLAIHNSHRMAPAIAVEQLFP